MLNIKVETRLLGIALATILAAGVCGVVPNAAASELNQKTTITFSAPFEVPGRVLPSGTYVFKLVGLGTDSVVQILNEKETHAYATIQTSPTYRARASQNTVIQFTERAAGSPPAIEAWYYQGRHTGQAFLYGRH